MQLTVNHLVVNRAERTIIDGLSLELKAGQAMTLLGPNGAGKTTLIRALAGFITPLSGTVNLTGKDLDPETPLAELCHYVGHLNGTKSCLTVLENLSFWSRYLNVTPSSTGQFSTQSALDHFKLKSLSAIPARYLSAGQKRRLALARLLVAKRPLWLLDEPTVSLDTDAVKLLGQAVNTHIGAGGLVIAATHIPLGLKDARELHLKLPRIHG